MSDQKTQPGCEIDAELYDEFKSWVRDHCGGINGHLASEMEKAIQRHMRQSNPDPIMRIEDDIATIKAALAVDDHDGGRGVRPDTSGDEDHAPAPKRADPGEPPATHAPRGQKLDWFVDWVRHNYGMSQAQKSDLREDFADQFGVSGHTAEDYMDAVIDRLDAEPDPKSGNFLCWGDKLEERRQKAQEDAREEAEEEAARVEQGEPVYE